MLNVKGRQLGRVIEVEIRNYDTGIKTTIGNDFEIEFEFHKTIDENQQASTGRVTIFGLTRERIKSLQSEGGQIRLRCGYENSEVELLFIAYITRIYPEYKNNTTQTIIECSANVMNYYFTGVSNNNRGKRALFRILSDYSKALGAKRVSFDPNNIPENYQKIAVDYITSAAFVADFHGSANDILNMICENFNMSYMILESDQGKEFSFAVTAAGLNNIIKRTNEGYDKIVDSGSDQKERDNFFYIYKEDPKSYSTATVLNVDTGLISVKTEYKIATAYEDQELAGNEEQTLQSQQKQIERQEKRAEQKAKEEKKIAEGKKVKPKVHKVGKIKVNRRYARVLALLNPKVKPQGHVVVESYFDDHTSTYRVREATYRGNNKRGDFVMDLYCEDGSGRYDKKLTKTEEIAQEKEINGDLGIQQEIMNEQD